MDKPKLSDIEVINLFCKLVHTVQALTVQCDFLTEEVLKRGVDGITVDKAQKMVKSMDKRLRKAEESDEGRNIYLASTLKEMSSVKKKGYSEYDYT